MLRFATLHQVPLSEFEFSWSKIADIQSQVRFPLRQLQDVSVNDSYWSSESCINHRLFADLFFSWRSWSRRTTTSTSQPKRPTSPTWGPTTPTRSNRSTASTPSTSPWWRCPLVLKCLHMLTWVSFAPILHIVWWYFQTWAVCLLSSSPGRHWHFCTSPWMSLSQLSSSFAVTVASGLSKSGFRNKSL